MKKFISGGVLVVAILLLGALTIMKLGLVGVNADTPPPGWESRLMPMALHASVARHASEQTNPIRPTDENLIAGADTYRQMCARCHSLPGGAPSVYGASFYPPAPKLPGIAIQYTDGELFWIIKHGIRNTGMPAWGNMLSDDDIWQIVAVLKMSKHLPPAVEARWEGRQNAADK